MACLSSWLDSVSTEMWDYSCTSYGPSLSTLMGIINILLFECLSWLPIILRRERHLIVEKKFYFKCKKFKTKGALPGIHTGDSSLEETHTKDQS